MEHTKTKYTRKRSGGGFSVTDLVILFVVLAVTACTVFGWIYEARKEKENVRVGDTCVVTFRIEATHREVLEGLTMGEPVYRLSDDSFLGYLRDDLTISEVVDAPSYLRRVTGKGSMVCVGYENDRTVQIGENTLTPGDVLELRTDREKLTVYILDVVKTDE